MKRLWIAILITLSLASMVYGEFVGGSGNRVSRLGLPLQYQYGLNVEQTITYAPSLSYKAWVVEVTLRNVTDGTMTGIEVFDTLSAYLTTDTTQFILEDSVWVSTEPTDGGSSITADTTWDGTTNFELLAEPGTLGPNDSVTLSYMIQVPYSPSDRGDGSPDDFTPTKGVSAIAGSSGGTNFHSDVEDLETPLEIATVPGNLAPQLFVYRTFPAESLIYVDATHFRMTVRDLVANLSLTEYISFIHSDTLIAYIDAPDVYVINELPSLWDAAEGVTYGDGVAVGSVFVADGIGANPAWDGEGTGFDTISQAWLAPGTWYTTQYTVTVEHTADIAWITRTHLAGVPVPPDLGFTPTADLVEAQDSETVTVPPPTGAGIIAAAMKLGAVGGVAGAYTIPCSLMITNIGTEKIKQPNVRFDMDSFFGTATMVAGAVTATGEYMTVNGNFDGGNDVGNNDSLLTATNADTLFVAEPETLSFTCTFDEVDETSWTGYAISHGQTLAAAALFDTTNCNIFQADGDSDPGEAGEDDPCTFTFTPDGEPDIITTLVASAAGNWVGCTVFPQALIDSVDMVEGVGNGIMLRDSLGASIATQFEGLSWWPDGTCRIVQTAAKFTHAGTWQVYVPAAPQAPSTVSTAEDCFFTMELMQNNDADTLGFNSPVITTTGRVFSAGFDSAATCTDDGTCESEKYLTRPGSMEGRVYRWWFADGSQKAWVATRNQKIPTGWGSDPYYNAGEWSAPGVANRGDKASEDTCTVAYIREAGHEMRLRWAADMDMGDGTDTARLDIWNSNSYDCRDHYKCNSSCEGDCGDNPCCTDPSCWGSIISGETYDYGGRFLASLDIRVQMTEGMDPEPVQAWHPAAWYVSTKAFPFTDDLYVHRSATWTSADSLLSSAEHHAREWHRGVDAENPLADDWEHVLMLGRQFRQFDAGGARTGPGTGPLVSFSTGGDQYEETMSSLKFRLSISGLESDSLEAGLADIAWKLAEQNQWTESASRLNCNNSTENYKNGHIFPHVEHGVDGFESIGRSGQKPTPNYMHGVAMLPMYYLTGDPFAKECYERWMRTMDTIVDHGTLIPPSPEPRTPANAINWLSMDYDMYKSTDSNNDLWTIINRVLGNRDWSIDPSLPGCTSFLDGKKLWQLGYLGTALNQAQVVYDRHGQTVRADSVGAIRDSLATILWDHGQAPIPSGWDGFRNPPCTSPPVVDATAVCFLENWGRCGGGGCSGCDLEGGIGPTECCPAGHAFQNCLCNGESWINFWIAGYASTFAASGTESLNADTCMRTSTRHVDSGYDCPFLEYGNSFQKQGVIKGLYWTWAKWYLGEYP